MNYSILFSKDIVVFICGMLSSIFVARHLGPEIYGSYVFVILILAYFLNFGRFRESISMLPYIKRNVDQKEIVFSLGLVINLTMSAISILLLLIIGPTFGLFENISVFVYPVLAVMIISESFMVYTTYILSYESNYRLLAGLSIFRSIFQTAGFAYLFFFSQTEKDILPYLGINAASVLLAALIGFYFIRTNMNFLFTGFREMNLKYYLKTGGLFYATDLINFLSVKGVASYVAAKMAVSNLAFFNMIFTHFDLLRFPNNALGTMMYPELSKIVSDVDQRSYIHRKIKINLIIYPIILIAAYFLYPKLVLLFYGQEYAIVAEYFPYVILIGGPYLIVYPIIHYFSSNGHPQYEGYIKLFSLFIQIASVVFFTHAQNFTLYHAILSQAVGFISFTIALAIIYNLKKLGEKHG